MGQLEKLLCVLKIVVVDNRERKSESNGKKVMATDGHINIYELNIVHDLSFYTGSYMHTVYSR